MRQILAILIVTAVVAPARAGKPVSEEIARVRQAKDVRTALRIISSSKTLRKATAGRLVTLARHESSRDVKHAQWDAAMKAGWHGRGPLVPITEQHVLSLKGGQLTVSVSDLMAGADMDLNGFFTETRRLTLPIKAGRFGNNTHIVDHEIPRASPGSIADQLAEALGVGR